MIAINGFSGKVSIPVRDSRATARYPFYILSDSAKLPRGQTSRQARPSASITVLADGGLLRRFTRQRIANRPYLELTIILTYNKLTLSQSTSIINFSQWFASVTGQPPFRDRQRLATAPELPLLLDVPTAAGKTAAAVLRRQWGHRRIIGDRPLFANILLYRSPSIPNAIAAIPAKARALLELSPICSAHATARSKFPASAAFDTLA